MIYPSGTYWLPNRFGKLSQNEADVEMWYIHALLQQGCDVTIYPDNERFNLPDEGRWPFCRKPTDANNPCK